MDFGFRKKHNFDFGTKSPRGHCPRCMRTFEEAISEQTKYGEPCDDEMCVFRNEIIKAIEDSKNSQFCIKCGYKFAIDDLFCINCGFKR